MARGTADDGATLRSGVQAGSVPATVEMLEAAWRRTERDRRYVVDTLHDNVVQSLLALCWQLDDLEPDGSMPLRAQLSRTVDDMWDLIAELWPAAAADGPLKVVLEKQLRAMTRSQSLHLEIEVRGEGDDPGPDQQLLILRVCREALANILIHASATTVTIRCRHRQRSVALHIIDDGVGAERDDVEREMSQGRYGLRSLSWAVAARGGRLRIRTRPGAGFAVHVRLPNATSHPEAV